MKLRIRGNSLRLRLTRSEVAELAAGRPVSESVEFAGGRRLAYRVAGHPGAARCSAELLDTGIVVHAPAASLQRWASGDEVSLEDTQAVDAGEPLRILIEKDFACLADRPGEDDSDAFPHPRA